MPDKPNPFDLVDDKSTSKPNPFDLVDTSQTSEAKKKWGKLIRRVEYSFFGICFAQKDEYTDND